MELLLAILIAALICVAICLVAWAIIAILRLIPVLPPFIRSILVIVVWVVAGLACIGVLIRALSGGSPWP